MLAAKHLKNASAALWRVVRAWVSRNSVTVSDRIRDERLLVCETCPFFDRETEQCDLCGCFVELKAALATEKCPDNRWADISRHE